MSNKSSSYTKPYYDRRIRGNTTTHSAAHNTDAQSPCLALTIESLCEANENGTLKQGPESLEQSAGSAVDECTLAERGNLRSLSRATSYLHWAVQRKPRHLNSKTKKARRKKVKKALKMNNGVSVNLPDNYGWTALLLATEKGNLEAVEELLKTGELDVDKRLPNGMTALDLALMLNESEIAHILEKYIWAIDALLREGYQPLKRHELSRLALLVCEKEMPTSVFRQRQQTALITELVILLRGPAVV